MGRKQKRSWQYILLFPAACIIILNVLGGCRPTIPSPELPPFQDQPDQFPETPSNQESAVSLKALENRFLDQAEASLKRGNASESLYFVAEAISCCNGEFSDRALTIIRAALAHPSLRLKNPVQATGCLQSLEAAVRGAGYGPVAGCWLATLSELSARDAEIKKQRITIRTQTDIIEALKKQIEKLKAVDLELVQPEQPTGGDGDESNGQQFENHSDDR